MAMEKGLYAKLVIIFINMSGHSLMGCPAARLETMVLVIQSYVLVYIVGKRR